ncbi:AsmA family protein [Azoarcus olearius]|uniref:Outer membrane protein n=1 Tax=Azoarcus sp. (strain BH72) TaxID=418699 RepID=A1KCA8_AZOSB|nr:AsmA family protein [Azoarcus olearius]CAL96464.1 outer membrane protein [Azoarcus olearius]
MGRAGKLLAGIMLALLALLAAAVVAVATLDWNRLRPTVNERVSAALGRPFAINGDLTVRWARADDPPGWRAWLPALQVGAADLVLGNPEWAQRPGFAAFERVDFRLALLPLLAHQVRIPRIEVRQPALQLERAADGRATWTFDQGDDKDDAAPRWQLDIGEIAFDRGTATVDDAVLGLQAEGELTPLEAAIPFADIVGKGATQTDATAPTPAPADYAFAWQARGRYQDQPFNARGKLGGLLALHGRGQPFPLQVEARIGATRITLAGVLVDPRAPEALDLQLRLAGNSLADLYPLTGVTLPETPPYSTEGHLIAQLQGADGRSFRYRDFSGRIGDSEIRGDLAYTTAAPRPRLSGELRSRLLRLADLGPLIGVDTAAQPRPAQPADRVLPSATFRTERWRSMDADVRFEGARIDRGNELPITDLKTRLQLEDGVLRLDPFQVGVAGGSVGGAIRLDGSRTPLQGRLDLHARRLSLKKLVPAFEPLQTSLGEFNGEVALAGHGNSVGALLGSADGDFRLVLDEGAVSRSLMEIAGLNVGNYVVGKLFGDEEVRIHCAVADFRVDDGLATARLALVDTENARVDIDGTVNFGQETLDLTIRPQSKGMRLFSLRSPLYVRGRFKAPDAGVQAGPLLARGAGMLALGAAVAPAAALLALVAPSSERESPCIGVLQALGADKPGTPR